MNKKTAVLLFFFAAAAPLFAQQGKTGYAGFYWIAPAEISVGTDSNFLVDRTPPNEKLLVLSLPAGVLPAAPDLRPLRLSDQVFLIKPPMLAFVADSPKRELALSYQPEIELFQSNHDQNSWNTNASADFTQRLTRRWTASVGDAYRSSKDPSRTLQNPLLLLPRGQYRENDFRGNIVFDFNQRTSFGVRYDNTATTFSQNDPLQRRILDTLSSGVSFGGSRMLRRNHRLRVTYSIFNTNPWNRHRPSDDKVATQFVAFKQPAHSLSAEYRFSINPRTVVEFSGGAVKTTLGTNYVWGISGDHRFGEIWVGGGYARSLSFFSSPHVTLPNGLSANSFYDVISFRMRGQPARKVGIDLNISGSRSVYGTLLATNQTLLGRSRFDYRLTPHAVAFVSAETYIQNRNDYVGTPLTRRRFFVGIDYSLSSETAQRTSRFNRDADNVALTEHGRLRTKPQ